MRRGRWDLEGDDFVAGRHYPRNWQEFEAWFPDDAAARRYLTEMRWFEGVACPRCGTEVVGSTSKGWWCSSCRQWFTLTSGTVFSHTRIGLRDWLHAVWLLTNEKSGVSAMSVARGIGVNYETAWSMLHKLRHTFNQSGRDQLSTLVEIDETYAGGLSQGFGHRGRSTANKAIVIIACEVRTGGRIGRVRMGVLPDARKASISPWIQQHLAPRTAVHTDGWAGYSDLAGLGYRHKVTVVNGSGTLAHVVFPRVHTTASLLKRWLLGTHQGGQQQRYLDRYIDEFVFRFNRRNAHNRGLLFYRVLEDALMPETHVVQGALRRPIGKRRPAAMTATAEAQRKQAAAAERDLHDWFEELDDGGPPDPFGRADETVA